MPEHNIRPSYRPDVDGLRALAILSVVIFHAFPDILRGGYVGVDIFFVISGYLISNIIIASLQRGDFSFTEFYAHRIKRIFPALILVLVATYITGWFVLMPDEFKQLGKHIAAGTGFVQNFVLWKESGYFDTVTELKPLMHLWSLAIEEQFYLIFPLLLLGAWKLGRNGLLLVIAILGLGSFALNTNLITTDAIETFYSPQTRFWELLVGALLAYIQLFMRTEMMLYMQKFGLDQHQHNLANSISTLGFLLIAASVYALNRSTPYPGWWAVPPVLGAFLLILAGQNAVINRCFLNTRLMMLIGLISYPLYLWHWPILSFIRIVSPEPPSIVLKIGAVCLSAILAWVTYTLIERPIRFGKNTWVKTSILCLLAIVVGGVGYNTFDRNGLIFRLNDKLGGIEELKWPPQLIIEDSCTKSYPIQKERNSNAYCKGNNETATIFIAGDSHSNSLYPGLDEIYPGKVLNIAGGACLPFFNVDSGTSQSIQCSHEDSNTYLGIAENNAQIKTILLVSRGPWYITGKGYGWAESGTPDHIIKLQNSVEADYAEIFKKSMKETLQHLSVKNKQLVFVVDIPELGFHPKTCISSPLIGNLQIHKNCAVSRLDYDERAKKYREIISSVLKDFPKVKVFDAASVLCDDKLCWAMKDGKMLYRDDNHLSLNGSREIARELAKVIQSFPSSQ
jgi:peptidoglycan/LPS O-acetylase OafA/YrhL